MLCCSLLCGRQLTYLNIKLVHFEVDISVIERVCQNVEELNVM